MKILKICEGLIKKCFPPRRFMKLSRQLSDCEILFKVPPLSAEIIKAVELISCYKLDPDEESGKFWEQDQNGACRGEYGALSGYLNNIPVSEKVLALPRGAVKKMLIISKSPLA